jgi:hypothetical protein
MHKRPLNLYERLSTTRMSSARVRAAVANLERAETILDLILKSRHALRAAGARVAGVFGKRRAARYGRRYARCSP